MCEGCNKKVDVLKRSLLADMPNTLIVHLQRIVFSFDTLQNDKVNSRFEFPNVLDLKKFSYKEVMKESEDEDLKRLMEVDDDAYLYRLVGVNIHVGTADHGHYYSIINTKRGSTEADEDSPDKWKKVEGDPWRVFDDAAIRTFAFNSDLKSEAFGGDPDANKNSSSDAMSDADLAAFLTSAGQSYGKSAYMLIYDRRSKTSLREVAVEAPDDALTTEVPYKSV